MRLPRALLPGRAPAPCGRPDGTPGALALTSAKRDEREVGLEPLAGRQGGGSGLLVCDTGYAGRDFARGATDLGVLVTRPRRKDEAG